MLEGEMKRKYKAVPVDRILFPSNNWIPVQNAVFEEVLPRLQEKRTGHLYLAMYNLAHRSLGGEFNACLSDLAGLIKCDERTARKCIVELVRSKFVVMTQWDGTSRSRSHKPSFQVPLANKSLTEGGWTPLPRFFITHYLPILPGSLLLPIFLYHQHMSWKNDCWPGATRLVHLTNWSKRTVYQAIRLMGHGSPWAALNNGLPQPLSISYRRSKDGSEVRHFSIRAVNYYKARRKKHIVVALTDEFRQRFEKR